MRDAKISIPDDHHDRVELLPDHQHPFDDDCEVDRRIQSVFFHHDIGKSVAKEFFLYVGKTLLCYRMLDVDTSEGRELFNAATEKLDNQIQIAKLKFAVRRLCREDPLAAISKPPPQTGPVVCTPPHPSTSSRRRNSFPYDDDRDQRKDETDGGIAERRKLNESGGRDVGETAGDGNETSDGSPRYHKQVELPPLRPLVSKIDTHPGYACRLCVVSFPRSIRPLILKDALCRFGGLIDVYRSAKALKNDKFMAFAEFATIEGAQAAKDLLHRKTIDECRLEIRLCLPCRTGGQEKRKKNDNREGGDGFEQSGGEGRGGGEGEGGGKRDKGGGGSRDGSKREGGGGSRRGGGSGRGTGDEASGVDGRYSDRRRNEETNRMDERENPDGDDLYVEYARDGFGFGRGGGSHYSPHRPGSGRRF